MFECSRWSVLCMEIARVLSLLACLGALYLALMEIFGAGRFSFWRLVCDLIAAAASWGLFVALGFAVRLALPKP